MSGKTRKHGWIRSGPRSGYFGEKAKPRGYCRECDKAFQRARESTGILTARQLEEAHYTALVERVLERSRILSLSFRACMVQAMEDWLSNAVATNHQATKVPA